MAPSSFPTSARSILWILPGAAPQSEIPAIEKQLDSLPVPLIQVHDLASAHLLLESQSWLALWITPLAITIHDDLATLDFIRSLLGSPQAVHVPILFFAGADWSAERIAAFYEAGATEHLCQPIDSKILRAKVKSLSQKPYTGIEDQKRLENTLEEKYAGRTRELVKSEVFLNSLIEHIPNMVFVKEATDLRYIRLNRAGEFLYGIKMADFVGKSDFDFFPREQAEMFISQDREVFSSGQSREFPLDTVETLTRGRRIFHTKKIPIFGKDGQPLYLLGISEDVTEIREAEETLKRSKEALEMLVIERTEQVRQKEKQLRLITDALPSLIAYVDLEYRYIFLNKTCQAWYGKDPASLIGTQVRDLLGEELFLKRKPFLDAAFEGRSYSAPIQFKHADKEREVLTHFIPDLDENGHGKGCIILATDVTEITKVRGNIEFLSAASISLSDSLDGAQILKNLAQLIVPRLADWCKIDLIDSTSGVPHTVAIEHPDPAMISFVKEHLRKYPTDWSEPRGAPNVIRTGKSEIYREVSVEMLKMRAESGEQFEELLKMEVCSAMFVPLQSRSKILGSISFYSTRSHRIFSETELAFAEELARRASTAMENAMLYLQSELQTRELKSAVKARDEFLSICSHELKTPLTSLMIQSEFAAQQLAASPTGTLQPERIQKLVETTHRQVERMSRLIEDMLDVARIASGKLTMEMKPLNLGELAREVLDRFADQLRAAGVAATLEVTGLLTVQGDRYRLEQVLTNLLTNAIRYGERKPLKMVVSRENQLVRILVRDHGMGIAPENLERIFQRFERAISSANISGLGLGLYIVRQILDSHQGKVTVRSVLGQGSDFIVELPALRDLSEDP